MGFPLLACRKSLMTIKLKSTVDYLLIWDRVDLVRMVILILICSKMLENARNRSNERFCLNTNRSHDKDCINNWGLHRSGVLSNTTQAWPNRETDTTESVFAKNCPFAVPIPVLIRRAVLPVWLYNFLKSEIQYFKYRITQYRHLIKS